MVFSFYPKEDINNLSTYKLQKLVINTNDVIITKNNLWNQF